MFSLALIILLPLPFIIWISIYYSKKKYWKISSLASPLLSFFLLIICYSITPKGITSTDSEIQSIFLTGQGYQRSSIANLVPEIDQFKFGSYMVPLVDPFINIEKSQRLRKLFLQVYREMRTSNDFKSVGSVMNYAYKDLLTNQRPTNHFYLYIPPNARGENVPLVVFLHGSGGNFKGYMWNWRKFAIANNCVVIAPSFGCGNWDNQGSKLLVQNAIDYCESNSTFKISKRYLIGLSNGGIGIHKLGVEMKNRFHGLALISPVMHSNTHSQSELIEAWKSRPILIIHGSNDLRITTNYIKRKSSQLKYGGINLQVNTIKDEDHFLFFSAWKETKFILAKWMTEINVDSFKRKK
ncbi:MAG: hypothetical protein COA79_07930 [Planctomycetota bacterium]|nr:MAG: hypothetical protein COA79_07930 [Planctomycetota bacterium]